MKIRCAIIDDEQPAVDLLQSYCRQTPFLELKALFTDPREAVAFFHAQELDLVFADVEMPFVKGTELAALLKGKKTQVVFTTAYPAYALQGYDLEILDFLLKPINYSRFLVACNKALSKFSGLPDEKEGIYVKDGYEWVNLHFSKIAFIRSDGNLLLFYLDDGSKISSRITIKEILTQLPASKFLKINKSYIVSLAHVKKIGKDYLVVGKEELPVGLAYKEELERVLLNR